MQSVERWIRDEPTLEEMLADPIVRILMERDGLSDQSVRAAFEEAAKRRRARAGGTTQAA